MIEIDLRLGTSHKCWMRLPSPKDHLCPLFTATRQGATKKFRRIDPVFRDIPLIIAQNAGYTLPLKGG